MQSGNRRPLLLGVCLIILFVVLFMAIQTKNRSEKGFDAENNGKMTFIEAPLGEKPCAWKFHKYVPSSWEKYWFSNIEKFQYQVCSVLARSDQANITVNVLQRIISLQKTIFDINSQQKPIDVQLSQMHYRRTCFNKEYNAIQLIEPLVGLIRDPLTMCPKVSSVPSSLYLEGEFALQSKRFLLLGPSSPFQVRPTLPETIGPLSPWFYSPGSKKILIDIGSSYFQSRNGNTAEIGTKWFYDYFKNKSIRFDRIIGYEHQPLNPTRVWEELPEDVYPFYTFINVGVQAKRGRFNPWDMIEAIAKPEDYVVVKLDIDTPPLESALMGQLLDANSRARFLIDELFFEKHVSSNPRSKEDKLQDSYELFTKLRQHGIRMHGWP